MKQIFYLIILLFLIQAFGYSQNDSGITSNSVKAISEYNRNAITVLILENTSKYNNDLKKASNFINIPDKFDDNTLSIRTMKVYDKDAAVIKQELLHNKIPNEILTKWFSRKENGEFDMSVIYDRGMYNATDDEVIKASSSKIGIAKLKDAGEALIDHSYILVLDYYGIQSMSQKYNKRDAARKIKAERTNTEFKRSKRIKNGWEGQARAYLFKLSFTDTIIDVFYNDLWIYEDDKEDVREAKKIRFNKTDFPIQFIMNASGDADGTQYNAGQILAPAKQRTREELFQKMIATSIQSVIFKIEKDLEDFKIKTPVYKAKPISAKIGRKEGLKTDQRFFVVEMKQKRSGDIVAKRKAVVRAKKIIDNRNVATGNSNEFSTFYQTSGLGIEPGMLMQQRNDLGIGLSAGYSFGGMGGGYAKLEFNIARFAASMVDIGITQLKLFGAAAFDYQDYDISNTSYDMSFTRWQIGLSKGFYIARNFSIAPLISYGQEMATQEDLLVNLGREKDDYINIEFMNFGGYATINITHFLQLMGTFNYYTLIGSPYDKERDSFNGYSKYTDFFDDRYGMSIDVGIRLEF